MCEVLLLLLVGLAVNDAAVAAAVCLLSNIHEKLLNNSWRSSCSKAVEFRTIRSVRTRLVVSWSDLNWVLRRTEDQVLIPWI